MDNVSDLLRAAFANADAGSPTGVASAPVPQTKALEVQAATDQKKLEFGALPDDKTLTDAYVMRKTGQGLATASPIQRDLATLSSQQFDQKYGPEMGSKLTSAMNRIADIYDAKANMPRRDLGLFAKDAAISGGLSVANTLGGLTAAGLGVLDPKSGAAVVKGLSALNDFGQANQSDVLNTQREVAQTVNDLSLRDNAAQYEEDKKTDTGLLAGLKHVGRDFISTMKNTGGNTTLLTDSAAQALGSILVSGPIAKGLGAVSQAALPVAARTGILGKAAVASELGLPSGSRAAAALSKAIPSSMMVSVGAQEAGGAYQQTADELLKAGKSPEDANRGALVAAALAGVTGGAAGKLSESFLEHPFAVKSLSHVGSNLLKETTEEALQGVTGQMSQNFAEGKDLTEGVGEQVAQGAMGGFLGAASTQAPGALGHLARDAVVGAGQAALDAVGQRAAKVQAANEAKSNVSDQNVAQMGAKLAETVKAPEVQPALQDAQAQAHALDRVNAQDDPSADPVMGPRMDALIGKLQTVASFDPKELNTHGLSSQVTDDLAKESNRASAAIRLAKEVNEKGIDSPEGLAAASELNKVSSQYDRVIQSDEPALDAIDDNHPVNKIIGQFNVLAKYLHANPTVKAALNKVAAITPEKAQELIKSLPEDLKSPEAQRTIDNAVALAQHAPASGNLEVNEMIMKHDASGGLKLEPEQRQALMASIAIIKAEQAASAQRKALGITTPMTAVTDNVLTKPGKASDGKTSVVGYIKAILAHMQEGDTQSAQAELKALGDFTQHMQNKVEALNTHYAQGSNTKPVSYKALNAKDRSWYDTTGKDRQGVTTRGTQAPNSIRYAQTVGIEGSRIHDIYAGLKKAFPELNAPDVSRVDLHPNLRAGEAEKVARAHTEGRLSYSPVALQEAPQRALKQDQNTHAQVAEEAVREEQPKEIVSEAPKANEGRSADRPVEAVKKIEKAEATPRETPSSASEKVSEQGAEAETNLLAKPEPKTTEEAFPNLHGGESNLFAKAYKLAKDKSRLFGLEKPLNALKEALSSQNALTAFRGSERRTNLEPDVAKTYQGYLKSGLKIAKELETRLQEKITGTLRDGTQLKNQKGEVKSIEKAVESGQALNWEVGGALHLIEKGEDGKYHYNSQLMGKGIAAALQWALQSRDYAGKMTKKTASALTGIHEDFISGKHLKMLDQGVSQTEAIRSLADKLLDYWGVKANHDFDDSKVQGIANGFAAELFQAMQDAKIFPDGSGFMRQVRLEIRNGEIYEIPIDTSKRPKDARQLNRWISNVESRDEEGNLSPLYKDRNLIDEAVLTDQASSNYANKNYYDKDEIHVAKTMLRNEMVPLTKNQRASIDRAQHFDHRANEPLYKLYEAIGRNEFVTTFGGGETYDTLPDDERPLNVNHRDTLVGRNQTVSSALDYLESRIAEMRAMGKPLSDISVKFAFGITKSGRFQMLGAQNPQLSKAIREIFLPTWATVDLSNQNGKAHILFETAIAQALGVKIHQKSTEAIRAEVKGLLEGQYAESVKLLGEHLQTEALSPKFAAELRQASQGAATPIMLHALQEYARYLNASPEERAKFRTGLYIEADGVTNGVSNAVNILHAGQEFTAEQIMSLERGGMLLSGAKTMNEFRSNSTNVDHYKAGSNEAQKIVEDTFHALDEKNPLRGQMNNLFSVMRTIFGKDFTFDPETGEGLIDRGIVKNPMTITFYGSGADGIANNLANEILDRFYQGLSKVAADSHGRSEAMFDGDHEKTALLLGALDQLLTQGTTRNEGKLNVGTQSAYGLDRTLKDPRTFTVSDDQRKNLQSNLRHLFVDPMREGIEKTLGKELMRAKDTLQKVSQAQSIVTQELFKAKIREITQDQKRFPSRNEMKKILEEVLKVTPLIDSVDQKFFPVSNESTEFAKTPAGSGLFGEMQTPVEAYTPADGGVKVLPTLVQGMGDGRMIQLLVNDDPGNILPVFDGVNFGLDKIEEGSVKANKAVSFTWMGGNPSRALHESFATTMYHVDVNMLRDNPELFKALKEKLFPEYMWKKVTPAAVRLELEKAFQDLGNNAKIVDARHKVLNQYGFRVDQMAGAQSPYEHKGKALPTNPADIAQILSADMRKVLGLKDPEPQNVTEAPKGGTSGAATILAPSTIARMGSKIDFTPHQREVWNHIVRAGGLSDYRVVVGSAEQIDDYRAKNGLPLMGAQMPSEGFIDLQNKVIYSRSGTPETLLHEAIHAATMGTILAHYEGRDLGPHASTIRDAIQRLEKMAETFQNLHDDVSIEAFDAFQNTLDAMGTNRNTALEKATWLNEFMAWALANKGLSESLKTPEVSNKFVRLAQNAWKAIKALIFGRKVAPQFGEDALSNLKFNAAILVQAQPTVADLNRDMIMFHNKAYGEDSRLSQLADRFSNVFGKHLAQQDPIVSAKNKSGLTRAYANAETMGRRAVNQGFSMTKQGYDVFSRTVGALSLQMHLDPNSMHQIEELYRHAMKDLTPRKLVDPNEVDQNIAYQTAEDKYDLLVGKVKGLKDKFDRSTLMPVFLGLALVDDNLRRALKDITLPKTAKNEAGTLDAKLENLGNNLMDSMANKMAKQGNAQNVKDAIDLITNNVLTSALDNGPLLEAVASAPSRGINWANDLVTDTLQSLSDKASKLNEKVQNSTQSKAVKTATKVLDLMGKIATEKGGKEVAEGVQAMLDRVEGYTTLREFGVELLGRTDSNASIYDRIKPARSAVQKTRQMFREQLPKIIEEKFKGRMAAKDWSVMHLGMGKADGTALRERLSNQEILSLYGDKAKLSALQGTLESEIKALDPKHFDILKRKSEQLAHFMMTGEAGNNLLANARTVSELFNERGVDPRRIADPSLVQKIDELTTLYAMGKLSQENHAHLATLVKNESEGMDFVLSYLTGQRRDEVKKSTGPALYNAEKGYIPSHQQEGVSLIVAHDSETAKLLSKSYEKLGPYVGSKLDSSKPPMSYFFAPVSMERAFDQGILQNVHKTAGGVDAHTGFRNGLTAGRITRPGEVAKITRLLAREGATKEPLKPVFNANKEVIAYERMVDPAQLVALNPNTNMAKMLGAWRGRQVEEAIAQRQNYPLIDALYEVYRKDIKDDPKAEERYVDAFDPKELAKDKVFADAVGLMTDETRDYVKAKFGNKFMVRRSMKNDVFGYRHASVGDAWTGTTRWSQETQNQIQKLGMGVFGNTAYAKLVHAEQGWQGLVKDAKNLIVVKSLIVPMANFASNMYQEMIRGVSIADIIRWLPRKLTEVHAYAKGQVRIIEAGAERRAAQGANDTLKVTKLTAEIQSIKDGFRRLSIWPLIEAGHLNGISEAGASRDDLLLSEGNLHGFIERQVQKLPGSVQTAARYALVDRSTALFNGLQKAIEYGDFLGKAIYYDHLMQRRGKSAEEALGKVNDEFINFDRLPGRTRSYLDGLGMKWFFNHKIRSTKIALSILQENPLQALLSHYSHVQDLMPVRTDSPLEANILSKAMNGSIWNAIGPGMLFHSPALNPVAQAMF